MKHSECDNYIKGKCSYKNINVNGLDPACGEKCCKVTYYVETKNIDKDEVIKRIRDRMRK